MVVDVYADGVRAGSSAVSGGGVSAVYAKVVLQAPGQSSSADEVRVFFSMIEGTRQNRTCCTGQLYTLFSLSVQSKCLEWTGSTVLSILSLVWC